MVARRLAPTPANRIARLVRDRDFCIAYARECLERAEQMDAEIKRIQADLDELAALRADTAEVRKLAGGRVKVKEEATK